MEKLYFDFAKKYLTYPELNINDDVHKKKISFCDIGENAYIEDIDDFIDKKPQYKKFLEKERLALPWEYEYVFFIKASNILKEPIKLPQFGSRERIYIIIEDNAEAMVHDINTCNLNAIRSISICVGNNARLYYHYAHQQKNTYFFSHFDCYLQKDSYLAFVPIITQVDFSQLSLKIYLQKSGANTDITGYYWMKHKQQCALQVFQYHQAPFTKSNLAINGILFDAAQAIYDGTIVVDENAHNSNAEQNNKNILMGYQTRAVSVPNLEVKTNIVQCKHGSAVGKLDPNELFYMQSRGISLKLATKMLLESFILEPFKNNERNLSWVNKNLQLLPIISKNLDALTKSR